MRLRLTHDLSVMCLPDLSNEAPLLHEDSPCLQLHIAVIAASGRTQLITTSSLRNLTEAASESSWNTFLPCECNIPTLRTIDMLFSVDSHDSSATHPPGNGGCSCVVHALPD